MPFSRLLVRSEMKTASSKIWIPVAIRFPEDNRYIKSARMYVCMYVCMYEPLFLHFEFFTSASADDLSLEFVWQLVSSSFQDSSQYSGRSQ